MKKLEKLTDEQLAILPKQVEKWAKIGLSTEPLDFDNAKKCAIEAYKVAGLKPPKAFYIFRSPLAAVIGVAFLKELQSNSTLTCDSIKVGDQVRWQMQFQLKFKVKNQVSDRVWSQVRNQVLDQVSDRVWSQVRNQVFNQVWDQAKGQVLTKVWHKVESQISDQVLNQAFGAYDTHWLGVYDTLSKFGVDVSKLKPLIDLAQFCGWWIPYENCAILQDRPKIIKFDDEKRLHCEDGPAIEYRDGFSIYSRHGTRIHKERI